MDDETLKDVELQLVSELMKNSRRSDRELARSLGVSQPTVSRIIKKLEGKGIIREYPFLEQSETDGFLISLDDEIHYRPLTFATLAQHVLTMKGNLQPKK